MAPDLWLKKNTHYTEKLDVWSLGTIYYELLVGKPPFFDRTLEGFSKKMSEGNYEFPSTICISPEAILFISKCLQFEEEMRTPIFEIVDDPYVFDTKWSPDFSWDPMSTAASISNFVESYKSHKMGAKINKVVLNSKV